jgi:hypothetical protein
MDAEKVLLRGRTPVTKRDIMQEEMALDMGVYNYE